MSEASHTTAQNPEVALGALQRHHFFLRRVHSLLGIIPVGVFLIEHMLTSGAILLSAEEYQRDINFIWNLPGLLMLEVLGIWVPLGIHAALGVVYTFSGRPNIKHYPYADNWRYFLQRVTGIIALIYIFFHISTTRWGWSYGPLHTPFDAEKATSTTAAALQAYGWIPWFYLLGSMSVIYHFANGLWTAAIVWGVTITPTAQKRWGWVCLVTGVVLAVLAAGAIFRFSTMPMEEALAAEAEMRHKAAAQLQVEENADQVEMVPSVAPSPGHE